MKSILEKQTALLTLLGALNCVNLVKSEKIAQVSKFRASKCVKMTSLELRDSLHNLFDVKSERQKNPEISTQSRYSAYTVDIYVDSRD